ncbi:MAG: OB-fold nucleic acid binding domain-containing protein [Clostridia bacterium]|nr:OB-fold nucleic acid binding domain-containing protein [Clostridia bacterium]MBQ8925720.1 OB-fold nucleic acid binding domain-containing protein [Clostridia bacterium]
MAKTKKKQKKEMGVGSIIALVVAALVLIGILAGVVLYVHSGRAGISQSAGLITGVETQVATENAAGDDAEKADTAEAEATDKAATGKAKEEASAAAKSASARSAKEASTPKDSAKSSSGSITYQSKVTAKQLGQYYDADTDAFRKAYDGKTVTVTGKLSGKSAKMLYVELATGTKVPMRVYLNSEEQRTQFDALKEGSTITVRGNVGVLYPQSMDSGGFQEMANGLIALDSVTLVK